MMWINLIQWGLSGAGIVAFIIAIDMGLGLREEASKQKCMDVMNAGKSFHPDDLAVTSVRGKRRYSRLFRLRQKREKRVGKRGAETEGPFNLLTGKRI
jgi:hypothetical protein